MGRPQTYKLGFPLLSILSHKEYIIVSGGVNSEKTTQNKIALYHKNTLLTTPLQEINTGKDVIKNLTSNGKTDLLSCTSGRFCILFFIDTVNNLLKEIARFPSDTDSQNASVINSTGDLLITGGDDTIIKVWKITLKEGAVIFKKEREIKSHTQRILHLDISVDDTMVCSASDDGTCRIFDIKTGDMVKKLSFSEDTQDINLKFSFCYFARDEKYMFTIQNPINSSGASYLTRWKLENNFDPEKTITLHKKAVTASCFNEEGLFMGIGTVDGYSKIINTRHFEIDCGIKAQDPEIQSVNFVNDSRALASVCADHSFYFLPNVRPEGWFSKLSKLWVAAMFLIYFLMFLYDKLGGLFRSSN